MGWNLEYAAACSQTWECHSSKNDACRLATFPHGLLSLRDPGSRTRATLGGEIARSSFPQRRLASEDMVIMLGETVGFVADVLQETQGVRAAA